jgi:hypothetical protein
MRLKVRYVFPIIALLALFSLGESPVFCSSFLQKPFSVEWVSTNHSKTRRCIHFKKCIGLHENQKSTFHFTTDYLVAYNQKLSNIFSCQTLIFEQITSVLKLKRVLFFPRLSIDSYIIPGSESAAYRSLKLLKALGPETCNYKISGLWSNQIRKVSSYYIFSNSSLKASSEFST